MADRHTEARTYVAHNTAPPLSKLPAHAGVSLGMDLCTQPTVSAYGADQALPLTDTIRYYRPACRDIVSVRRFRARLSCQTKVSDLHTVHSIAQQVLRLQVTMKIT